MHTTELGNIQKLFTFHEGWDYKYVKKKGIPRIIETLIKDRIGREQGPGEWSLYIPGYHEYPPSGGFALPTELYFEVPANNKLTFDFLGQSHKVKVVSEAMMHFLGECGLTDGFEVASLTVISKSGKTIETQKNYFAMRFCILHDDLIEFGEKTEVEGGSQFKTSFSLYPNMRVKEGVMKNIFVLKKSPFDYYLA